MHRFSVLVATSCGLAILTLSLFAPVLFRSEQFGYRDAEQYYYPLHKRTVEQWKSGHLPLWDSNENGGMTLIGNPTAAVLYPGKLVFAVFSYPWAARLYLIGHVVLAFVSMTWSLRRLGISPTGAVLGGLSYGFGGPVVFQCCNAIYLVGSSWLPLGFLAADCWLRESNRKGIAGLAVVLAMLCLGGDIQAAYLLGLGSAAYGIWLAFGEKLWVPSRRFILVLGLIWLVSVILLAAWLPSWNSESISPSLTRWGSRLARIVALASLGFGLWKRLGSRRKSLTIKWAGLIAAALIGASIAAVQLVPVAELASQSFRMAEDNRMDLYGFSVEPYRVIELVFPGFYGIEYPENRLWLLAIPPIASHALWTASLYMGGITLLLVCSSLGGESPPRWRGPVLVLTIVALFLSFGRFGGPLWWARYVPQLSTKLGPHGPSGSFFFRSSDGFVKDAFGTVYGTLAILAPGLDGFRFPAKLLPFAAFGISTLAALGWDRITGGGHRRAILIAKWVLGIGLVGILITVVCRSSLLNAWETAKMVPSLGGPIDASGALWELRRSLVHGTIIAAFPGSYSSQPRREDAGLGR